MASSSPNPLAGPVGTPPPPAGVARRTSRGQVITYGTGRLCIEADCDTRLSQYNQHSRCAVHESDE
jgi:hypothetical protein